MDVKDVIVGEEYAIENDRGSVHKKQVSRVSEAKGLVFAPCGWRTVREESFTADQVLRPWKEHTARKRLVPGAQDSLAAALACAGVQADVRRATLRAQITVTLDPDQAHALASLMFAGARNDDPLGDLFGGAA